MPKLRSAEILKTDVKLIILRSNTFKVLNLKTSKMSNETYAKRSGED